MGVHLETKQMHGHILRSVSASSDLYLSLGLGLRLVCETRDKSAKLEQHILC